NYAEIEAEVTDATPGAEASRINFRNYRAGNSGVGMYLQDGLVMAGAGNDMGTGTINAKAVYDDGVQLFGPRCVVTLTGLNTTPTINTLFNTLSTLSSSRSSTGVYTFTWTTALNTIRVPVVTGIRSAANAIVTVTATT